MLSRWQHFFSRVQAPHVKEPPAKPSVLAITPFYMDQLALRIASSRKNWDLLICPTLRSGLRTLRKNPVSVILYDLETRDADWRRGFQLLLTQAPPACLIALTKDLDDDDLCLSAFECGAYDVQAKPLKDNLRLLDSVRAAHALVASHELIA